MNRAHGLLVWGAAIVLVAAGSAQAVTYVPLNISGAFNMNAMAGPVATSQACANHFPLNGYNAGWLGWENQGYGEHLFTSGQFNASIFPCDSSSNDGVVNASYTCYQQTNVTLTGTQGLPENGLIYSSVDGRTYCIASVSGNFLLPGDWTEATYNPTMSGQPTLIPGINYGPNTYTASNNKFNAVYTGSNLGANQAPNQGGWNCASVTTTVQPGYYSDINFILAGEEYYGLNHGQIWITYADVVNGSNSIRIFNCTTNVASVIKSSGQTGFALAYQTGRAEYDYSGSPYEGLCVTANCNLWEFATPLTLDSKRVVTSITFSEALTAQCLMAVFGATATASDTASNTLTLQQTTSGTISASQSGVQGLLTGYPYGAQVTLTATGSGGYDFTSWKAVSPAGNGTITGTGSQAVLTIYGSCTVSTNFTFYSLTTAVNPSGAGTVTPSQATPYSSSTTVTIQAAANPGYTFSYWTATGGTLTNAAAVTTSLAITNNCLLTANFTQNSYSGSETETGGTITLSDSGPYTYGQVITATVVTQSGYNFAGWSVTGPNTLSSSSALTTTLTIYGDFTLTANFTADALTASATLDHAWVYQNLLATTLNRQCRPMIITVQDTWPDTSYTVVVTQNGSGVVIPSLTFVAANGAGSVTSTSSFGFTGSSAMIYLVGGPLQADGVTGTGSCTVTLRITGDFAGANNTATAQTTLTVRRLGDTTGNGTVTTADRVQLRKWLNGRPTPNQTAADFDLDGDGTVTTNDLSLLNDVLNKLALPPTPLALTTAVSPAGYGTVTVKPSKATYSYGDQLAIVTVPNSSYGFSNWSVTGGMVANPGATSTSLTVLGNVILTANFVPGYTLTLSSGPQGTAVATPSQANYNFGDQVTITMSTITVGNVLDHWTLTGPGALTNSGALSTRLTFASGNVTISAVYTTGSYVNTLSPSASDSNVGSLQSPYKTIGKAMTKPTAGSTIVVQQGVYREAPFRSTAGTPGNPITIRTNPGDRVVVSGADMIPQATMSWTQCTSTTASGNPNYANMYYTDVNWSGCWTSAINGDAPFNLCEDEHNMLMAQTPGNGPPSYWTISGSGNGTGQLIDTHNLTQSDSNYWQGTRAFIVDGYSEYGSYYSQPLTITAYDPATSKLSFTPTNFPYVIPGYGFYCLYGSPKLIGGPGQWAVEALSTSNSYRLWIWPTANDRPDGHVYEATRWGGPYGVLNGNSATASYWTFDGLEVCHSAMAGIFTWGSNSGGVHTAGGYNTIRNCVLHDNDSYGINAMENMNGQYIHNLITKNGFVNAHNLGGECGGGFNCQDIGYVPQNELYLENEIGWNNCDGFFISSDSCSIVGNYIHNNGQMGHSDGIQLCLSGGNSATIINNLFIDNGDVVQSNDSSNVVIFNNVAVGIRGFWVQGGTHYTTWDHNTLAGVGNRMTAYSSAPGTVTNNLWDTGQYTGLWVYPGYYSDSNLVYLSPYVSVSNIQIGYSGSWMNWSTYLALSGMDHHTITDSLPLLNAAPAFYLTGLNYNYSCYHPGYSASTVYIPYTSAGRIIAELWDTFTGDYIEINCDGVLRQVTNVDLTNSILTFTPSSADTLMYVYPEFIYNWKTLTCTSRSMDVGLQANSPAKGTGGGGSDIGALNFNVADYCAGKLNGNTSNVIPIWPPAPVTLAAAGWQYMNGGTANSLTEGGTYTNPNMTGFKLTFGGAPLYALSCTTSAVKVFDNTGTTYPVSTATLDSTGTVLTITLTSALPRNVSWIQVNVGPLLMGANGTDPRVGTNGGPVTGVKSMRFTIN